MVKLDVRGHNSSCIVTKSVVAYAQNPARRAHKSLTFVSFWFSKVRNENGSKHTTNSTQEDVLRQEAGDGGATSADETRRHSSPRVRSFSDIHRNRRHNVNLIVAIKCFYGSLLHHSAPLNGVCTKSLGCDHAIQPFASLNYFVI
ncbi:hypothetical protein DMENIID0001_039700 [Sergentomyia squamirostris]